VDNFLEVFFLKKNYALKWPAGASSNEYLTWVRYRWPLEDAIVWIFYFTWL